MKIRDYLSDAPWYWHKATLPVRNGLYRAGRPYRTVTGNVGNYRRRRFAETGKGFRAERATRGLRSSLPVYRKRINPATGRPRADDREVYGRRDAAMKRMRERAVPATPAPQARDYAPAYKRGAPLTVRERADRVLGPGRSARAADAWRRENVNPWAEQPRGRTR